MMQRYTTVKFLDFHWQRHLKNIAWAHYLLAVGNLNEHLSLLEVDFLFPFSLSLSIQNLYLVKNG
jgi:hypothetical protein